MSLFLSENHSMLESEVITLEEAYVGLIDVQSQTNELNEAILVADYQLHESLQYLTEEEASAKKASFLSNVLAKLGELLAKAKDAIVRFFNAAKRKAAELVAKVTGNEIVEVPKGVVEYQGEFYATYSELVKAMGGDNPSFIQKAKAAAMIAANKLTEASKDTAHMVQVKLNSMGGLQKICLAAGLGVAAVVATKVIGKGEKEKKEADGLLATAKKFVGDKVKETTLYKSVSEKVNNARGFMGAANYLTSLSGKAQGLYSTIVSKVSRKKDKGAEATAAA